MNVKQVEMWEAERIWAGKCPVCGGNLLPGPIGGMAINVMCEFGCKRFNVLPKPMLPERI